MLGDPDSLPQRDLRRGGGTARTDLVSRLAQYGAETGAVLSAPRHRWRQAPVPPGSRRIHLLPDQQPLSAPLSRSGHPEIAIRQSSDPRLLRSAQSTGRKDDPGRGAAHRDRRVGGGWNTRRTGGFRDPPRRHRPAGIPSTRGCFRGPYGEIYLPKPVRP